MKNNSLSQHSCKFMKTCKALDTFFPTTMKCWKLRRKFRELMLISEENGRKCCSPQGTVAYMFAKEEHLTQNYYMIHPFSKFRQYWESLIIIETIICIMVRPFVVSQKFIIVGCTIYYQLFALIIDLIELSDVFLSFFTGYVDKEAVTTVLDKRKVFIFVIRRVGFYINLVTSVPLEFFQYLISPLCLKELARLSAFLKVFRLVILTRYLVHLAKIYNWGTFMARVVWFTIISLCVLHWLACMFYIVIYGEIFNQYGPKGIYLEDIEVFDEYFHRHFKMFYLVSSIFFFHSGMLNQFYLTDAFHVVFSCFILIFTYLSNVIFIGMFVQYLGLLKTPLIHYEGVIQEVQKFLIQENLPKHLHTKIMRYFQFRYQFRYFREKLILDTLSRPLKQEIADYICKDILMKPGSIFSFIESDLVSALCLEMKFEVFLTGDVIIRAGKKGKKIYFIYCGSAVVYSRRGKELKHLFNGDQFGEAAFADSSRSPVTVIALELSEYLVLRYEDFVNATEFYPSYRELVKKAANERLQYWLQLTGNK